MILQQGASMKGNTVIKGSKPLWAQKFVICSGRCATVYNEHRAARIVWDGAVIAVLQALTNENAAAAGSHSLTLPSPLDLSPPRLVVSPIPFSAARATGRINAPEEKLVYCPPIMALHVTFIPSFHSDWMEASQNSGTRWATTPPFS